MRPGYQSWETKRNIADVREANIAAKQSASQAKLMEAQAQLRGVEADREIGLANAQAQNPAAFSKTPLLDKMMGINQTPTQLNLGAQPPSGTEQGMSQSLGGQSAASAPLATPLSSPAPNAYESITGKADPLIPSMAGGGVIDGPPGLDQVAAEFSDGRPARLDKGEVVLPKEFVHQLGVAQIRKAVEAVTGKKMDPTVKEPLPGQGEGRVLGAANGMADSMSPADYSRLLRRKQIRQIDESGVSDISGNPKPPVIANPISAVNAMQQLTPPRELSPVERDIQQKETAFRALKAERGPRNIELVLRQKMQDTGKALGYEMAPDPVLSKLTGAAPTIERPPMSPTPARQPRTEQQMLDSMAPAGGSITREGRVFRMEDPMAIRGREVEQAPLGRVVQPGEVLRGNNADDQPVRGGWLAGRPQAGRMLREARAYDHLPISGVTYSDSVQGLGLGQRTPPATDAQTMEDLKGLYKKEAAGRATERVAMGLPGVRQALVNRPAVTTADRAADVSAMRDATAQDQLMAKAVAELKLADRLRREQFDYTQQKDEAAASRQQRLDMQKEIDTASNTDSPPLGLPKPMFRAILTDFSNKGYAPTDVLSVLYSINDPEMESAIAKGEPVVDPETGELVSPLDQFMRRLDAILGSDR